MLSIAREYETKLVVSSDRLKELKAINYHTCLFTDDPSKGDFEFIGKKLIYDRRKKIYQAHQEALRNGETFGPA